MDFALDEAMQHDIDSAAEIATRIAPGMAERQRAGRIDPDLVREMGRKGLIAPELPRAFGGRDGRSLATGMIAEQIARGDLNVAYVQIIGSLVGQVLARNAPEEIAARWIPHLTSGAGIVAIGLSEPGNGSDAGSPSMTAHRERGGWVLRGTKSMSFAMHCDAAVVFARTADGSRGRGLSAFLVELDREGITRRRLPDMGTTAVGRGLIDVDGTWVPEGHLLGTEGCAFTQVMQGFDFSRALIGMQVLGAAQATLEETWEYTSTRTAFDRPLSSFQGLAFPLAEAETQVAAARLLCQKTLWLKDNDLPHTKEAAMCKWWAPKTAYDVIHQCLLSHGQYGYLTDRPIEQRLRDVLGLQIGDGTAQIMKLVIARHCVDREAAP
ncbi:cyclohexanecarboxyl-CoA dehydrogenase [Brachybacterium saurashtrense]|uniref:Cyclohexanecarboxyl-CoA dehydrogenase n=2 Tax=Brachybacterium saurashtrense TaxID=556288 RepID=A0A345YSW5_9MICO|nr:cyclohexanecarboxyl-CoA dehydrogenase [Brachybacterium saurashtrense]RRR20866.1 cyclohexanecarboxyl-CoA dehydrogenase [Brachybacterium saurashtrense]